MPIGIGLGWVILYRYSCVANCYCIRNVTTIMASNLNRSDLHLAKIVAIILKSNQNKHTKIKNCKNWKLRQKHQIHLCFLRWHICQERGRKERLEIDRPVGSLSIDWYCRTVLTIVKMKELLSNYSSVYKRRDNFFVYKGQSIMGLILEVDRIGLSHGEAVW